MIDSHEICTWNVSKLRIPHYGEISVCNGCQKWTAFKSDSSIGKEHFTIYPALQDLDLEGFRLSLWEQIVKRRLGE